MKVIINGKPKELSGPLSLDELIASLGLPRQAVAVQHNGEVVRRDDYATRSVQDGDRLEIVRPIGGGSAAPAAAWGRQGSHGSAP